MVRRASGDDVGGGAVPGDSAGSPPGSLVGAVEAALDEVASPTGLAAWASREPGR